MNCAIPTGNRCATAGRLENSEWQFHEHIIATYTYEPESTELDQREATELGRLLDWTSNEAVSLALPPPKWTKPVTSFREGDTCREQQQLVQFENVNFTTVASGAFNSCTRRRVERRWLRLLTSE